MHYYLQLGRPGNGYGGEVVAIQSSPIPFETAEEPILEIPEPNFNLLGYRYLGALIPGVTQLGSDYMTLLEEPPVVGAYWNGTEWIGPGGVAVGILPLEPASVSDATLPVYSGDDITINCEYTCTDPTATVTYTWTNGGGLPIVGATNSSFTFTGITEEFEGNYTCTVLADNGTDTGSLAQTFSVVVYPAIP
jgi:hypothetical protein